MRRGVEHPGNRASQGIDDLQTPRGRALDLVERNGQQRPLLGRCQNLLEAGRLAG
jgi:hypothetical protein